ncbi:putative transferase At1g60990, chloroplastic [Macadamia integrifolia]|uniref:putative transferase At1g60990, chloroplastic n=1 Tax=Macadamia integrifolia TaxID=60698 RepID=UPI001C4E5754|nr:putative transferase At1g60990, chloroplastic [Macadamia integrifolia]
MEGTALPLPLPSDVDLEIQATPPIVGFSSSSEADHIKLARMDIGIWFAATTPLVVFYYQERPHVPSLLRFSLFAFMLASLVYLLGIFIHYKLPSVAIVMIRLGVAIAAEMMADLGANISEDGTVETFGNDDIALKAVDDEVVVVDLTHFGRIRVTGEDRIQFLQNQSTANFESLREGQGCDTVFVTPTARTIDIAHAWVMKNAITLVVSPLTGKSITEMLTKYIFFADKVEVQDITKQTCFFVLIGPKSNKVMEELGLGDLVGKPYGTHLHYSVHGMPITVGVGGVIFEEGFSLLLSPAAAGSVWKALVNLGVIPMGANAFERLRILQGTKLLMTVLKWDA